MRATETPAVQEPTAAPEPPPAALSPLGRFCRDHQVQLPEAIWFGAHVVFDGLILLAWALRGMPEAPKYLAVNLGSLAGMLLLRPFLLKADRGLLWIVRHWYAVTFYGVFFIECGALVPALNPSEWDVQFARCDRGLCGGDPVAFFQRLHHPALSEFLQFCYATYYFLPLVAGGAIMKRLGVKQLADGIAIISVAFYGSYAGYFLFPAVGPRFSPGVDAGLSGLFTFDAIHTFLAVNEGRMHDCMPSGHTAVTLITLLFAWRASRPVFWAILPFAAGLILSTVYLHYHYVVDLVAAVPFTAAALLAGAWLVRVWDRITGSPEAARLMG